MDVIPVTTVLGVQTGRSWEPSGQPTPKSVSFLLFDVKSQGNKQEGFIALSSEEDT